ncbi:MAG TPA: cation:dicarboxylase symporter family transporter, partial [Arthrobacter sp.]|nr:cation:dicarboxylase symporter family transporter [Arthrobacter sp.]
MSTQTSTPSPAGKTGFQLPRWAGSFGFQIIAALIVGLGLGLLAKYTGSTHDNPNALGTTLQTLGSSYVSLLQTAVVPLIFTAVVSSISNLRQVSNAARLAWNTLLWFAITSLIAVLIGMGLGVLLQPGANTGITQQAKYTGKSGDWWAFLVGLFPKNFLGLGASSTVAESGAVTTSVSFNVLQILVIAIAVGVAALKVGKAAEPFLNLNASALAVIQKVLWWIIRIAPLGTVGLIGNAVAVYGWDTIGSLGKFTFTVYAGLVLVLFVVYPILVRSHGLSIRQYFSGVW